jgi:non-ribosomal peptide synthase protein (TIGR01720 family)
VLTALTHAFVCWTGKRSFLVDLESHGRQDVGSGVDVSRTVGWFTAVFPIELSIGHTREPSQTLKRIKEQLRGVPNGGIGFGLLRYVTADPEVRREMKSQPQPEVIYNNLGQFDHLTSSSSLFRFASESTGPLSNASSRRSHLLEATALIADGCMRFGFRYSENFHDRSTVESLAGSFLEALRTLIDHCASTDSGEFTPSDFPLAQLDQGQLDRLLLKAGRKR